MAKTTHILDETLIVARDTPASVVPALRSMSPLARQEQVQTSVIIVTWNSERWIERCLTALPAACGDMSYEILVYDNHSSDRTLSLIGREARVIGSPSNDGFAAGTNRGAVETRGRYLFLLNPDCELAPGSLRVLHDFLDAHPEAAAAVPVLTGDGGQSQREFQLRRLPTLMTFASTVLLLDKILPANRVTARYRYRDLSLDRPRPVEQPAAAAMLLRREVYDRVGPLDEEFTPAWFEDVDYCRRLAGHGEVIYVVPEASARHFGGASLEHVSFEFFTVVWYRNLFLYASKWFSAGETEALRWFIILGMLLRIPPAILGLAHPEVDRWSAVGTYARVLRSAFRRWGKD